MNMLKRMLFTVVAGGLFVIWMPLVGLMLPLFYLTTRVIPDAVGRMEEHL